jgi:hypothetical protein
MTGTRGRGDEGEATDESEPFVIIIALIDMITMRTFSRGATSDAYLEIKYA